MNEFKIWAQDISFILIFTGLFLKTVSGKSERRMMRIVTTLIIIVAVFRINISVLGKSFKKTDSNDISSSYNELSSSLYNDLSSITEENIRLYITESVKTYDEDASAVISINSDDITIRIISDKITDDDLKSLKLNLEKEFCCELSILKQGENNDS